MFKKISLAFFSFTGLIWNIVPFKIRENFFFALFLLESRSGKTKSALSNLFLIEDKLQLTINERALALGHGEHPKHKLMNYHDFFISHLNGCNYIADIGCGYGAVSRSVAQSLPNARVVGIENNRSRFEQAVKSKNPSNLSFEFTDIQQFKPVQAFDAVILSNVLEHVEDRVEFLEYVLEITNPRIVLLRVPSFERHWSVAMRKELEINYFLDPDHKIEHTLNEIETEVLEAGLRIDKIITKWGEIWIACTNEDS